MADFTPEESVARPGVTSDAIRRLSRRLGENPQFAQQRLNALAEHDSLPLPDRVRHLWRYTDPNLLVPAGALDPLAPVTPIEVADPPDGGATVVLQPGDSVASRLSPEAAAAGVEVAALSSAAANLTRLGTVVPAGHGVFEALNGASWNAGVLIRVPAGVTLKGPLHVVVPAAGEGTFPRLLVVVEPGAAVDLVEEHERGDGDARVYGVTEVFVGAGSRLRHVVIQGWSPGVRGHLTHRTVLERDAEALTVLSNLGGRLTKADVGVVLAGEGARSEIVGMVLGEKRQHFDLHTEHRHLAGKTSSDMDIRAAVGGRARSAYTGLIRIEENAPGCEAFQRDRNLLLSARARAETIPELEILNADVTCTHGATATPVDPEPLFYLQSRGIAPDEAARLVVQGFFEPILERIPEPLRARVRTAVERRVERLKGVTT